jgi:Ca2+-binding EF-hand superfamily protein
MGTEAVDRVGLIFTLLDANDTGAIEAKDFELMANRVIKAAPRSDAREKEAMSAAFRRYWETLAEELDDDRNGRINREEYQENVLSPERFEPTIDEFANALARLGDPDGDGLVERRVFNALMSAIGFEQANIDSLFDALEPNRDDRIAVSTWVSGIKDYYRPDASNIPGDRLVSSAV